MIRTYLGCSRISISNGRYRTESAEDDARRQWWEAAGVRREGEEEETLCNYLYSPRVFFSHYYLLNIKNIEKLCIIMYYIFIFFHDI